MSRRTSAGSIFWGLTLVAIGGLFLARNFGYAIPIWSAIAKYWPVLIIMWGLLKLVDYFRLRNAADKNPLFSGGEVFVLILVIFAGSAITAGANISPDIGEFFNVSSDFDFWDLTGNNYQYTEHQELSAASGSLIQIFNLYGSVEVKPSDDDHIVLDVAKTVRAASKEDADRLVQDFTFSIKSEGDHYRIASNRDPELSPNQLSLRIGNERQRYKSNLVLHVPRKSRLELNNKYGTVDVEGLEGMQSIANKYGSSTIKSIVGSLKLDTGYGTVVVDDVSGDVDVTNGYASTTVRNVGGRAVVNSRFGATDVQDVKGNATIDNRYSIVNVQRIAGNLTVTGRNDSVDVDDVAGAADVETSYKNLSIRNARGTMTLKNRHGNMDVELDKAPSNAITVSGDYSDVTLEMPGESKFSIDGKAHYGDIYSEFEGVSTNSSGRDRSAHGTLGSLDPTSTSKPSTETSGWTNAAEEETHMYCYQCGIELSDQAKFCSGCGRSTAPAPPKKNMETHVQVVAWLFIGSAVLYGMLAIALLIAPRILEMFPIPIPQDVPFDVIHFVSAVAGILGAAILIVSAGTAAAGVGLLQYQTWGRTLALVMATVMLLKVPFGTFIGIYAFWVLLSRPGREYYEHKSALAEGRAG